MTDTLTKNSSCCTPGAVQETTRQTGRYTPQFDIWESDEELVLLGDLPGVSPDGLDIRYENGELVVHGTVERRGGESHQLRREYGIGDFHRIFSVSEHIQVDAISATLKDGVLTLRLPKAEAVKPRRIEIRS